MQSMSHVTRHTSHVTRLPLRRCMPRHRNSSTLASRRGACARSLSAADKSESRPLQPRDFMTSDHLLAGSSAAGGSRLHRVGFHFKLLKRSS